MLEETWRFTLIEIFMFMWYFFPLDGIIYHILFISQSPRNDIDIENLFRLLHKKRVVEEADEGN